MNSRRHISLQGNNWIFRWGNPGFPDVHGGVIGRALDPARTPCRDPGMPAARLEQTHGAGVARVDGAGVTPSCDAVVTAEKDLLLRIRIADCVPVFLASPNGIGLAHAGWRGTVAAIVSGTVAELAGLTGDDPKLMRAFIGPSIGPCCYEVGTEVLGRFDPIFIEAARRRLDLRAANRQQLVRAGIPPASIAMSPLCTKCHQHILYSHRGSHGGSGRMEAVLARHSTVDHCDRVFS